jgi:tricarballylate dehydrogenase
VVADSYSASSFTSDIVGDGRSDVDANLVSTFVERSFQTAEWLRDHGVEWLLLTRATADPEDSGAPIRLPRGGELVVKGRGVGLVEALYARAEAVGVDIQYETIVDDIVVEDGRVRGVRLQGEGALREIHAPSVIVASGGFEASAEARAKYLGEEWASAKVRGTRFNTGILIERLVERGAARKGDWRAAHSVPIDIAAPAVGDMEIGDSTSRYSYPYGITVNINGERFTDEGSDEMPFTYSELGRKIIAQPGALAFQIFDDKTTHLLEERYTTASPARAGTIGELAAAIDIDAGALTRTIDDFNSACSDGIFDPGIKDGLAAAPTEQPPKSNWAQRIDHPPYRAYPVTAGITFTTGGGLATDAEARVLAADGIAIAGLFAAGEIAGGFLRATVPTGAGLMRGAAMALIAAQSATTSSDQHGES